MDRWQAMKVFVRVAQAESFVKAGRDLNMSAPSATRLVSSLENLIGVRLLTRTTRSVKLTEAGARYFQDCQQLLGRLAEIEASAMGAFGRPTGTLTVTASVIFGTAFVLPVITEYLDSYPDVIGRAMLVDRLVNLVDEHVDVAVRIGHLPDSGFAATSVGHVKRVICGSTAYFEKHGVPRTPAELANHRVIATTSAWTSLEWRFGTSQRISVHVTPKLFTTTNEAAISAAASDFGLTRVLSYQVSSELESGRLQTVLGAYEEEPLPVHIIHPDGRHASVKVRAFVDLAVGRLRANRYLN